LGNRLRSGGRVNYGVGGFLPDASHAIIEITDFNYLFLMSISNKTLVKFITEITTGDTYWYRQSRATQALSGLYYSSLPILLCSPTSYNLLLKSEDRKALYC
jgi:hypothetical protein